MKEWKYFPEIEGMSQDELRERIKEVMSLEISPGIVTIPYAGGVEETVEYHFPELTAKCPMTGIRDFYTLIITFQPEKHLPELKALRKYFGGYDELPISHEHLAAKIFQDFRDAVKPAKFGLVLDTAVRGGIKTIVKLGDA